MPRGLESLTFVALALAGCVATAEPEPPRALVDRGPPPLRAEDAPPPRPSPRAAWIPGAWRWDGVRYAWAAGHWAEPPEDRAAAPSP